MVVRIHFGHGPKVQKKKGKNKRFALAVGSLLTPAAVMSFVLGVWRLAADLKWTSEFGISTVCFRTGRSGRFWPVCCSGVPGNLTATGTRSSPRSLPLFDTREFMRDDRQWRFSSSAFSEYFPIGVKWLLISNVAMFILSSLASGTAMMNAFRLLSLVPEAVVKHFAIWQLGTYMFLHGGFDHILFNMLGLWMCGSMLERDWGTRRFLKYYFVCGVGAGLCDVILECGAGALGNPDDRRIGRHLRPVAGHRCSLSEPELLHVFPVSDPREVSGDDLRRDGVSRSAAGRTPASATSPTWAACCSGSSS